MKLIDADKLIEKLSANLDNPEEFPVISLGTILRMIDNEPEVVAHPEQKWIPCSERLPEESGYYIITAHDGVGHRTTFVKYQKKAKSWDLTGARSYWRVIAWMPLPEPYAGKRTKETDCDYERAVEQLEHDILYEPTFNQDDGSM